MSVDATILMNIAQLPLRARRRALRLFWQAKYVTAQMPPLGVDRILRDVLRVSTLEAKRLDREVRFQDWMSTLEWAALLKRSADALERDSKSVIIQDQSIFEQVAGNRKAVILAPIHMGCFALPFARIMFDHFTDRRMLILRAREDRHEETLAMKRISEIGIDMRFLNVADQKNYVDAVKFARTGSVIVTFVDLPSSYGGPARVNLFGKPAQLAMGIASLARLTEATVIPISVQSTVSGDAVRVGGPFETYLKGPQEKDRVANLIRRHIDESVRDAPEQWHMWPRFNEFLDPDRDNEAA